MVEVPSREVGVSLSLAARVALAVAGVLMIGGILVSVAAFAYGRQAASEAYDRLLIGAANDIAASITIRDGQPIVDLPQSAFELLALAPDDRVSYRVIGPNGATLTGYESAPTPEVDRPTGLILFDANLGEERGRFVSVTRLFAERSFSGSVQVIVGQTSLARRALAVSMTRNALIVLAIAGVAMAALAIFAVRSALRPLDRIGDALQRRDPYDLTPIDLTVPREAAVMVRAQNSFMGRLDRQVASMRNLIEDSAHQLRTPVAAIRAQAELAAREEDDMRRGQIVANIYRRSVSMGRLLDQMLSRALVIHRAESVPRELFDLRELAVEVLEDFEAETPDHQPSIRVHLPADPVVYFGDKLSLAEACKNLLNNALQHGTGPIELGTSGDEAGARIWVSDAGQGPPPEILARLGERFARSSASKSGSAGLGLAIAYAVADAHGGHLDLGATETGGFQATLVLPKTEQVT